ncbi:MAG TPA: hypothetical protein VN829_15625 [Dongiaceae bacterium]|nr:hypothetical protein [Dongiaceae bacterium]
MAASHPRKSLALDTNLLPDLAAEADFAHTFREVFLEKDYLLLDIDEARLLTAFNDSDLQPVRPMHPRALLRATRPG